MSAKQKTVVPDFKGLRQQDHTKTMRNLKISQNFQINGHEIIVQIAIYHITRCSL